MGVDCEGLSAVVQFGPPDDIDDTFKRAVVPDETLQVCVMRFGFCISKVFIK